MTETTADEDEWAANRLFHDEPSAYRAPQWLDPENEATMVDLGPPTPSDPDPAIEAGARRTAVALGATLVVAVAAIVVVLVSFSGGAPASSPPAMPAPMSPAVVVAAPTTMASAPESDQAIPYTASTDCPARSTSAQSLADPTRGAPWTCVRGQQGARVDGQVLHVDLGGSHVLSAVSVTPGWVPRTPAGHDEWLQHRVVTRLQYVFNDADRTVFTQDTGNVHGPVLTALPSRVLASRVTVIVLQTARPPTTPPPSPDPGTPALPGFGDSVLGAAGIAPPPDGSAVTDPSPSDSTTDDPVDATFAISTLTFMGHKPT